MKSEFDAKKFVQLFMAGYVPRSKDEKKFVDKHVAQLHQDVNGNKDDVFKATNVPTHQRPPYHGYNKGQDERMYEDVEQIDEISKAKLFNYINSAVADLRIKSFDAGAEPKKYTDKDSKKRSRRQAGIGRAAKKLAFGKVSEAIELVEEEMTDAQMAKRERIVKSMKKKSATFEKRYGDKAKEVMYATATKMAMEDLDYVNLDMTDEVYALIEEYEEKEDREKKGLKHIESHAKKVREVTKKYPVAQRNESSDDYNDVWIKDHTKNPFNHEIVHTVKNGKHTAEVRYNKQAKKDNGYNYEVHHYIDGKHLSNDVLVAPSKKIAIDYAKNSYVSDYPEHTWNSVDGGVKGKTLIHHNYKDDPTNESVIEQLIAAMELEEEIVTITFDNGEEAELERDIAESIVNIFNDLSEENQVEFALSISEGIEAFEHALAFIAEAYEGAE